MLLDKEVEEKVDDIETKEEKKPFKFSNKNEKKPFTKILKSTHRLLVSTYLISNSPLPVYVVVFLFLIWERKLRFF